MKIPVQFQTKEEDNENVQEIVFIIINSKSNNSHYQSQYNSKSTDKDRIKIV